MDIIIGDWSEDGHRKSDKHTVLLRGSDVGDEKLYETFTNNVDLTGVNPLALFKEYEDDRISADDWNKIVSAGFESTTDSLGVPYFFDVEADEEGPIMGSFIELLMWYATNGTDTTWEVIENPTIFGGFNPIIPVQEGTIPGYGLFH